MDAPAPPRGKEAAMLSGLAGAMRTSLALAFALALLHTVASAALLATSNVPTESAALWQLQLLRDSGSMGYGRRGTALTLRGGESMRGLVEPGPCDRMREEVTVMPPPDTSQTEGGKEGMEQEGLLEFAQLTERDDGYDEVVEEEVRQEEEQARLKERLPGYDADASSSLDSVSEPQNPVDCDENLEPRDAIWRAFRAEADNTTTFGEFIRARVKDKVTKDPEVAAQLFPGGDPQEAQDYLLRGLTPDCSDEFLVGMGDEEGAEASRSSTSPLFPLCALACPVCVVTLPCMIAFIGV